MNWKIEAKISLKKGILDPQGTTVEKALLSMGYNDVQQVRVGKHVTFYIENREQEDAEKMADEMCRKVLSNPVIEEYTFTVEKA